ncbi:ATP-dependent helicase [Alicyclobacillus sp. ALC3]|uniref:ATP-dependent helicase n=1 Tax=Alicyclobacillus sp. ALC3 TaxID=2796143 RepID=UPI002379B1E8|nr:ATP-dependent helicase [Alicyclobacillus sp. ALC3]WDL99770.1 UvrD-helicase domain-containing protein [Alicyclobacillus sp. ALC3]
MGLQVEVVHRGRRHHLSYEELATGGEQVQTLLHELYEVGAVLLCTCRPERPVPMHMRRIRIRPPTYAVVTNPYHEHARDCPRHHMRPAYQSVRKQPLVQPASDSQGGEVGGRKRGTPFVPSLGELNDAQREAATHKDGPCIVIAAAGSGKTAMLIQRIKFLMDSGVPARRILACTFTKKAASEMKTRLIGVAGDSGKEVTIGTIHSVAYRMVLPHLGDGWRVVAEPSWLVEQALEEPSQYNPHAVGGIMKPADAITAVFKAKADGLWPSQVEGKLGQVYAAYEAIKTDRQQIDFEDLLLQAIELFRSDREFAKRWQNRWDYVLVDEFQDTNMAQWMFILQVVQRTNNLCAIGDDWQAIYSFRGSKPELMGQFVKQFPQAKKVFLTTNYRSHDLIVELGNRIIDLNRGHQVSKKVVANREMSADAVTQVVTVQTDIEEAKFVASEIADLHKRNPDVPWSEYAILYRTNIQSRVYEEALAELKIPNHVVGDVHFYENRDVKVILDYLRTTQDTSDASVWGHLLNRPRRFIPIAVVKEMQQAGWNAVAQHPKCQGFVQCVQRLKQIVEPAKAIEWLVSSQKGLIREQDEDDPIKWVDSLITSASRYRTGPEFLRYVEWIIEQSKKPKKDAVQLLTIHRSKGLEYENVFVAGLAEGLLPHNKSTTKEAIREETRLAYVAITRAKQNLYLLAANKYGDKQRAISRFVRALQEA